MPRRSKYQTGSKTGMRKFRVKKGVNYFFSPVKTFSSKAKAKQYSKNEKARRPRAGVRHRIVPSSKRDKKRGFNKKFTIYQTHYP
jgi:hypothetical protein